MRTTNIILNRDFRELRQSNAFRIIVIASAAITVAAAAGISVVLGRQEWVGEATAAPGLELITGLIAYFMPLLVLITFIWSFVNLPITKEKVNGNIECLLATPLTPRALWLGKCLAVFLPGYVISVIAALVVLLAVNLFAINPAAGHFVMPAPALLTGFIINPLLFFGLLAFIVLFSLAGNPEIAIAPSFILGFGLMIGLPLGLSTGAVDPASWGFALWYLVGTTIALVIVGCFSRLLTRQNIILSGKGY